MMRFTKNVNKLVLINQYRVMTNKVEPFNRILALSKSRDIEDINEVLSEHNLESKYLIDNNHTIFQNAIKYKKNKIVLYYCSICDHKTMDKFLITNCIQIINEADANTLYYLRSKYDKFNDYIDMNISILDKLINNDKKIKHSQSDIFKFIAYGVTGFTITTAIICIMRNK